MNNLRQQIEEGQRECMKCIEEFSRFGGFKPSMCKFCEHGMRLHELEIQASEAEKLWDACDWNSAKYNDFYRG